MRASQKLAISALVVTIIDVLLILGGFWYWAIFDLNERIGSAIGVTVVVVGIVAAILFMTASDQARHENKGVRR